MDDTKTPRPLHHGKWRWLTKRREWAAQYVRDGREWREVFGKRTEHYLGALTHVEATRQIRALDARADSVIRHYRALPSDQKTQFKKHGDLGALIKESVESQWYVNEQQASLAKLESAGLDRLAEAFRSRGDTPDTNSRYDLTTPQGVAHWLHEKRKEIEAEVARVAALKPVVAAVLAKSVTSGDSLDALLAVWRKVNPESADRKVKASLNKLKAFLGDGGKDGKGPSTFPWRDLTDQRASDWRDALQVEYGAGSPSPEKHLTHLRMLFKAAKRERLIRDTRESPFHGVEVYGGKNPNVAGDKSFPFSGSEILRILLTAPAWLNSYGRDDASDYYWVIRLVTFMGLRPSEACNILRSDLDVLEGVRCVRIRVSLPGEQPQGKAGMKRDLPLHPAVADLWDYKSPDCEHSDSRFLFSNLKKQKPSGRYSWLEKNANKLIKDECGIFEPDPKAPERNAYTLYSLRHSYHDAMDAAGIPDDIQRELAAHVRRDSHANYGRGVEKRLLAEAVKLIDPLKLRTLND